MIMKKEKIAIVTDSSSGLPVDVLAKYNIRQVNIPVELSSGVFREGDDLDPIKFQMAMRDDKSLPVLGQVPSAELKQMLLELKQAGYTHVICILLSSGIQSLVSKMEVCANGIDDLTTIVFDSQTAGAVLGDMVQLAAVMVRDGCQSSEIVTALRQLRGSAETMVVIRDIRNLSKHGYISNGATMMSNVLLRLKTLALFDETGRLAVVDTRSRSKKAYADVKERISQTYHSLQDKLTITILAVPGMEKSDSLDQLRIDLRTSFPEAEVKDAVMPASLEVITGEKSTGICWDQTWDTVALR